MLFQRLRFTITEVLLYVTILKVYRRPWFNGAAVLTWYERTWRHLAVVGCSQSHGWGGRGEWGAVVLWSCIRSRWDGLDIRKPIFQRFPLIIMNLSVFILRVWGFTGGVCVSLPLLASLLRMLLSDICRRAAIGGTLDSVAGSRVTSAFISLSSSSSWLRTKIEYLTSSNTLIRNMLKGMSMWQLIKYYLHNAFNNCHCQVYRNPDTYLNP